MSNITDFYRSILGSDYTLISNIVSYGQDGTPLAYILNNDKVLINADDGEFAGNEDLISISFRCLARFFTNGEDPSGEDIRNALKRTTIIDFYGEDIKQGGPKSKPGPGYVFREYSNFWHRSPTVLLYLNHRETAECVLMGVDDDQYFGCSLPQCVDDIEKAYEFLKPSIIRKTDPSFIKRQGEWFFVELDGRPEDYIGCKKHTINYDNRDIEYYLRGRNDNENSNTHVVNSKAYYTVDDSLNINGGNPIVIFEYPTVSHNQHEELWLKGFWWAIENTALRSFSEEGVD